MFRKIFLFVLISISFCLTVFAAEAPILLTPSLTDDQVQQQLPYYEQIMKIIQPLEYSGFQVMTKSDVSLKINFEKKGWVLTKIHQYDSKGNLVLEQGRYGLCAELSAYVYERLKSLVSSQYEIKFAMATEKGFFPTYQSNHIVLLMRDQSTESHYLIDPSFHKYGKLDELGDYQVLGLQDTLSFIRDQSQDVAFLADQSMPLLIKDDLLLHFSVTSVDEKFDKNNFFLVVSANKRNKISGLNVIAVGKYKGQVDSFEDRVFLEQVLSPEDIETLHKKLDDWLTYNEK